MSYEATLLVFGILLLLVGLLGKVKAKELEVGTNSRAARIIIGLVGMTLIVISMVMVTQQKSRDSEIAVAERPAEVKGAGAAANDQDERARKARIAAEEDKLARKARIAAEEEEQARKARIAAEEEERARKARIAAEEEERARKARIAAEEEERARQARLDAEQQAGRFFDAWKRLDTETLIAMSDVPFRLANQPYYSRDAVRQRLDSFFQQLRSDPRDLRRIQTLTVYEISTKFVDELPPELRKRFVSTLSLDDNDLIVWLTVGHDGTPESQYSYFFRNTEGRLALVGTGGS